MARSLLTTLIIGDLSWTRLMRSLLLIYILFALYVFFRADSMLFLPPPASYQDTDDILKVPVTDTERISAIYLPNLQARYTLLYSHGNAEDLGVIRPQLQRFHSWGFSVLAYDYRGYGTSDGRPSERHAYADADAAYTYLSQQLQVPAERIIAYGRSVGGGTATELATRHRIAGLILESTFTSVFRVVVPFPLLPFDKFANRRKIRQVQCPVLIMHGEADRTISIEHGHQLYAAAPEPKQALWVAGADHNDFTWVAADRHRQALISFRDLVANSP
ncbi:Multifunctional-autoprocessing repeats-in-toxin [Halomicronema hongdechloris C2206]|uniref:Multifunctional-autoprocessing repeats-in-toxin n=1 Tax=Halomicronema hongdechloris C2206 TaxID=1641165 RepID=A0A1Z3HFZ2_9CYAN|nr:alpha/beta hydrolase [Halomicronema hongdechloris]ASC69206.1 Multifunctional-autoprocessing repeats-in-toxin [Halomicronema hongdechloris C2206]